ncbi:MAG: hypothetical protein MUE70_11245 [Desulfobacterales bacterium]|nr:hypothetical protein [Desulfobacterales bacterium]
MVTSKSLIGERLNEDISDKFDGIWETDDGELAYIKCLNNGDLLTASVSWKDEGFQLEKTRFILSKCNEKNFINFPESEIFDEDNSKFVFCCYSFVSDNTLIVWMPRINAFAEAIGSGQLKGNVTESEKKPVKENTDTTSNNKLSVVIEEPSDSLCNFIKEKGVTTLFDLENPIVYKKIKKLN